MSQEVEGRFGKGSAVRCGLFDGCDLSDPKGIEMAKFLVTKRRPVHVWVSCPCGPFCPLQRLNRNSEAQAKALAEKQRHAKAVYKGAIEVATLAESLGSQVHWELAERSEAWNLPFIQEFMQKSPCKVLSVMVARLALGPMTRNSSCVRDGVLRPRVRVF